MRCNGCSRGAFLPIRCGLVEQGETIAEYPNDLPYPSQLILGFVGNRPIHLVMGYNEMEQAGIVITVYEPSLEIWRDDFKKKRRS